MKSGVVHSGVRRHSFTWGLSVLFSGLAILSMLGMAAVFLVESLPVWRHEGAGFVKGTAWFFRQEQFGAAPMIYGTLAVGGVALLLAAPLGLGAAIFTAEFLPGRLRLAVKTGIELLAGIPSVVYGLLGILLLRGWVYELLTPLDPLSGDTILTAGILLAVMILPTVMTLSDDALRAVPAAQRLAGRALGLTGTETVLHVALPRALPGIAAALLLAFGRALGETIAVFLVVGRQDNQWPEKLFSWRPLTESGQTLASKLGGSETNIAYGDPLHWAAICGLGLILLTVTGGITWLGSRLLRSRTSSHAP